MTTIGLVEIGGAVLQPPERWQDLRDAFGMTPGEAAGMVGGLSRPSKMPGAAFGLPAAECLTGSRLRAASTAERPTVCGDCYALKGRYMFANVQAAQYRRLEILEEALWEEGLADPQQRDGWVEAMVCAIAWAARGSRVFRWHDSGDLRSPSHLQLLVEVADRLPWVRFWLPTREGRFVRDWLAGFEPGFFPANLCVRESAALVGHIPDGVRAREGDRRCSAVVAPGAELGEGVAACRAPEQGGECADCRACWDRGVGVVAYVQH